ncbi:PREDICTED: uncharacterized protein LOC109341637 [Lupinus angustifolius]|uniref:uncharacterized protein LOC109341637 n=1 Tax=Lupinus angustifolius TaxID=3871 RepID=UPI00092E819A|nr:PREDICTED: uncharacterized protein LOC109341637 [Lupinus angustifolius]
MSLQLANKSIKYLEGVAEDVLVKVYKFLIPVDFVVIDITEDTEIPLVLGRPFIRTTKMGIDMENGKLLVRVIDDEIEFDIFHAMHHPKDKGQCMQLDIVGEICVEHLQLDKSLEMQENKVEEEINKHFSDELFIHQNPSGPAKKDSELELKELPSHLKYAFLDGEANNTVIIYSELSNLEEENLIQVLKKHQAALGWTLNDLKGFSPSYCMHKIMMEDDYKPCVQPQRRLHPAIKAVTSWRVCIDYRKLNAATRKDHFPLPFMDQMIERLVGRAFYCFLDGKMPFRLCNAPATFQRCMLPIFADLVEKCIKVFTDDFSVFGESFETCLTNLETILERCEQTNLVLNLENVTSWSLKELYSGTEFQPKD